MSVDKERFKLIPVVYLLLRDSDGRILLQRRANTGYRDGYYSLVAGHIDGDALATHEMVREAKEEAGIDINPADLKFVHVSHLLNRGESGQERISLCFETDKWRGEVANTEPHKCDDLSWFALDDLPDNTIPFVRDVLADIAAGIQYSEYTDRT